MNYIICGFKKVPNVVISPGYRRTNEKDSGWVTISSCNNSIRASISDDGIVL